MHFLETAVMKDEPCSRPTHRAHAAAGTPRCFVPAAFSAHHSDSIGYAITAIYKEHHGKCGCAMIVCDR